MSNSRLFASTIAVALMLSFAAVGIVSALTVSCSGTPTATNITWTGSTSNGVAPFALLWGNGATSTAQTIAVSPGTYSMTLQATDASSTVATTTCSATILPPAPIITSFVATPASITAGQSSVLLWVVTNASSTSIDNGIGALAGTSTTVMPSITTTYRLSAVNPGGTTTASATITVSATSTDSTLAQQILSLLNQIAALKAQLLQLILQRGGATSTPAEVFPPGCFDFHRDLHDGDEGDDVRELQHTLSADPSIFPPGLITGFFGHRTEEALRKFQRKFGIFSTGFFGPRTRNFLEENCGKEDTDHDGIPNAQDTDDDNDGTPDVSDARPHNPNVASTTSFRDDRDNVDGNGKRGEKGEHGKKKGHEDEDDDD